MIIPLPHLFDSGLKIAHIAIVWYVSEVSFNQFKFLLMLSFFKICNLFVENWITYSLEFLTHFAGYVPVMSFNMFLCPLISYKL